MTLPYTPEQILAYKADNERRVREAAQRGDVSVDGMPLKVTLELTADCNFFCRMCEFPAPREEGRRKGYELDMRTEVFDMLAPQVFPHALMVNLSVVGEPLMVPYLDKVLETAREWQTRIEFITNGQLLDQRMIERVGPQTAAMIISFDGGTRRTFNRIRIGGDFNVITRNMLLFDRWRKRQPPEVYKPGLHMNVTLMRENIEELPTIIRVAKLLNVDRVNAALMIAFNEKMARSSLFRHKALANACLRRAQAVAEEVGIPVALPAPMPGVTEDEVSRVVIHEPDLPEGPLPHLQAMLAGGDAPDLVPEPAHPDESFHEFGANIPESSSPVLQEVNSVTASKEREYGSPLQQSAEERRLQAQLAASPPPSCGTKLGVGVPAEPPKGDARYTCKFLWNELFVSLSGDVAPCCIQGRPIVGSIHQQDLASIWNGPMMQLMRRRLLEGDPIPCCKDCNYNTQLGQGAYREDTYFVKLDRRL
jgi:MoaA/NifB/PqqE/SkfB family radical SAM enzyme